MHYKEYVCFYKGGRLTFDWVLEAYTCTRIDFDNFLYSLVKAQTSIDTYTGVKPSDIQIENGSVSISLDDGKVFKTKIIVGADGAQSVVAKRMTANTMERRHHVGSIRAYFSNVQNMSADTIELYFDKRYLPSYLWVFPVSESVVNAGIGMLSSEIAKRKINLKKVFYEFIEQTPALKQKFSTAIQAGEPEGFGLPLGSNIGIISGDHFMLAGDAASLIDPITGDGIGNAMLSGKLAAEQIIRSFEQNDFSADFMSRYDKSLSKAIGKELKTRYRAQRVLAAVPLLLDAFFLAGKNKMLKKMIQKGL